MPKKIMLLALCAIMACAMFTGCWWDNSSSSSSSMKPGSSSMMPGSSSMMPGSSSMMPGSTSHSMSSSVVANATTEDEKWALRVVNAANPLPENFSVDTAEIRGYDNRTFDARAAKALEAMLADAESAGNKLYLVSAYRSISRQKALFERKTNFYKEKGLAQNEAEAEAAKWVARPGTSEHNLGLAADIVSADWYKTHSDLTQDFDQTPAFAWLRAHAADYGFILRYPKGKESITGVFYEPWHYRYVGKAFAESITKSELALEEFRLPSNL